MKKLLDMFRKPSAMRLAQAELEDAERELLAARSAREYAAAIVSYQEQRVARLRRDLGVAQCAGN
ncbi:MAG: hypothetical protein Q8K24_08865 [Hydrogenophaga sp.]|nr:hypothetical protein [Hydrogenophaga sp.]